MVRTPPSQSPELRLLTITEAIEDWIARLGPSVVSIERVFAQDNLRSVIGVAQVMGTAMATAARAGLEVAQHTPSEAKAAVTGSGTADKAQVQAMVTRILGLEHPDTLLSRSNLAGAYLESGRLDKAIELLEQTLTDRSCTLGPNHPDTLTTQANLAITYRTAGRLDEAITLLEQNLKDFENLLGPDNPLTQASRHNLAGAYHAAGRFEDAEKLFETPSDSEEDEQDGTEEDPDQETGD